MGERVERAAIEEQHSGPIREETGSENREMEPGNESKSGQDRDNAVFCIVIVLDY